MHDIVDVNDRSKFNPKRGEIWTHDQTGDEIQIIRYVGDQVVFLYLPAEKQHSLARANFALQYTFARRSR